MDHNDMNQMRALQNFQLQQGHSTYLATIPSPQLPMPPLGALSPLPLLPIGSPSPLGPPPPPPSLSPLAHPWHAAD
jgi:hypothetical protein